MNVIQEIKDLKRRFNFLRKSYETYEEPQHEVKRYKALLSQSGTDAPTAIVRENTLGVIPTFTRTSAGLYILHTNIFIGINSYDKIFLYNRLPTGVTNTIDYDKQCDENGYGVIYIYTWEGGDPSDDRLIYTEIFFEIYP